MIPSNTEIDAIPLARAGEYELNKKETATLRSRLYSINKAGYKRYRTLREGSLIMVWRIK